MENQKYAPSKKYTKADGTIMYMFDNKLHSWDGPALIPEGILRKRQYFINGIQYSEKEWKELCKQRSGLPFYKQSGGTRF
jgi:hypothetical protein